MIKVFVEAAAGNQVKGLYDEEKLERKGERLAALPYSYPFGFVLDTRTADGDGLACDTIESERRKSLGPRSRH